MGTLRKGKCYRPLKRPYTRTSKFKTKSYISTVPSIKVTRFNMGDLTKKFGYVVKLVSKDNAQIRHNAIESARQVVNRHLHENLGTNRYYLTIDIYPHHILRENKMLGGAHADRLQTGMAHSFGRVIGAAAQVKNGKSIMTAHVDNIDVARDSLKKAIPRLPVRCKIEINKTS